MKAKQTMVWVNVRQAGMKRLEYPSIFLKTLESMLILNMMLAIISPDKLEYPEKSLK